MILLLVSLSPWIYSPYLSSSDATCRFPVSFIVVWLSRQLGLGDVCGWMVSTMSIHAS